MRDIMFYVKKAIDRSGAKSERRLCEMMDLSHNSITHYRRGALPTDETMMKLAVIAGIDPYIALLDLNAWRTKGDTQTAYKKILEKITAAIFVISAIFMAVCPAIAADRAPNSKSVSVYYGK